MMTDLIICPRCETESKRFLAATHVCPVCGFKCCQPKVARYEPSRVEIMDAMRNRPEKQSRRLYEP